MGIRFLEDAGIFLLETPASMYAIALVGEERLVSHLYYGSRFPDPDPVQLLRLEERPFQPDRKDAFGISYRCALPAEYPGHGTGDFRPSCLRIETAQGHGACLPAYVSHEILPGKPGLPGLPATFGGADACTTLVITCRDRAAGVEVALYYTVFEGLDAIARSARIRNCGTAALRLYAALSACLDLDDAAGYDLITLHGAWMHERMISRHALHWGTQGVSSRRGISSHEQQPFLALAQGGADQSRGAVYAMHLVYSGNFTAQAEMREQGDARLTIGIHPEDFCWTLAPDASFQTPEAILVYSACGLGGMTRTFHDLYRGHLIRSPWRDRPRPVPINSWETAFFAFNTETLLVLAREAAACGIDLLVVDDGWFGRRNDDRRSLGDWYVSEEKLPGGLARLAEGLAALGMRLGLWIEPEMISPDSDLYRAHPEYALQIPGRAGTLERGQLVLDFSRADVREAVYSQIKRVLQSAPIAYVKWDMNRALTDLGSAALPPDRQGELAHRYVLGVYEMQERLLTDFPGLLLENCCGGGGRFDPGMLYYSPQIWCSDQTDAMERLKIQEGTALLYPLSTIGAHVTACPSSVGRTVPLSTRAAVAMPGAFGYELDLTRLSEAEKAEIPRQIALNRQLCGLYQNGDYYRLASVAETGDCDAFLVCAKDKRRAVLHFVQAAGASAGRSVRLHLEGLDPGTWYRDSLTGRLHTGAALQYGGLLLPRRKGDFQSILVQIEAENRP